MEKEGYGEVGVWGDKVEEVSRVRMLQVWAGVISFGLLKGYFNCF